MSFPLPPHPVLHKRGKTRTPYLNDKSLRIQLHSYLAGINNNLGSATFLVNGIDDHVHILCLQPRTICMADPIRTLKTHSSKWMKGHGRNYSGFA
ncbi:MAG: transposase [Balneolales bacterium]